jgi:hypothetical protein
VTVELEVALFCGIARTRRRRGEEEKRKRREEEGDGKVRDDLAMHVMMCFNTEVQDPTSQSSEDLYKPWP